jgi:hypothetical protein
VDEFGSSLFEECFASYSIHLLWAFSVDIQAPAHPLLLIHHAVSTHFWQVCATQLNLVYILFL